MSNTNPNRNRDGSSIDQKQYAALLLAVLVPPVGLGYGLYMRSQEDRYAGRVIAASLVAFAFWVVLVFNT